MVAALRAAWQTRVREHGEGSLRPGELLEEAQSLLRTVDAVDAEDLGVALQKLLKASSSGMPPESCPFSFGVREQIAGQ